MRLKLIFLLFFFTHVFFPEITQGALPEAFLNSIPSPGRDIAGRLTKNAERDGIKGDYFRLRLAEVHIKKKDFDAAFRFAARVQEPLFSFWKDVLTAKVYLAKGKHHEVLALLRQLPAPPKHELSFGEGFYENLYKRALMTRYLALQALGRDAHTDVAEIGSLYPFDEDVKALLGEGLKTLSLATEQKIDKLHAIVLMNRPMEGHDLLTPGEIKSAQVSSEKKCRSLYELGTALRSVKGKGEESLLAFEEVLKLKCVGEWEPKALYWLGSIRSGAGLSDSRKHALLKLYQKYPFHRLADDALYKLYQLAVQGGNGKEADRYEKMLLDFKGGDMKHHFVFEEAFPLYRKGKYKKAAAVLKKAIPDDPTPDESYPRVLYWYGRSLEKTDGKRYQNEAGQVYRTLADHFPFSFYAILAAKRLGTTIKKSPMPVLKGSPPENGLDYFSAVDILNREGSHEAARTILDFALHQNPTWIKTHREYIVHQLIESRNYRTALELASEHFQTGFYGAITGPLDDPLFAAFFPLAFPNQVQTTYQTTGLPFGAIEGIMREESLFQRTAVSIAGARGLMQLMPATAAMVRGKLGGFRLSDNLNDPFSNILLGATYLKDMNEFFDGKLPLAIMAYNAGPGNVKKWVKKFGDLELDEFIEEIPLSETRSYVKRVMRSMQIYGLLYDEPFFESPTYFSFQVRGE